MPRSGVGAHTLPSAATYTTSGFVGWMRTREICRVALSPSDVHILPASVDFHTPSPCETLPRNAYSPPPTYTTSGLDAEIATAPIVPPKKPSVTGAHHCPPSSDLKTPPPPPPM